MKKQGTSGTAKSAALKYTGVGAPNLVAKGEGYVAEQINRIAEESDVPLMQDEQLTELLCAIPLGDEIPESLYVAVAEVLAYVFRLNMALDEQV